MTDTDDGFGGTRAGLSTILVAGLCIGVFVFTDGPVDAGGVTAGVALALVGLAQLLAPRVSPWATCLGRRWRGAVWMLLGGGVTAFGVVAAPTAGGSAGGLLLGASLVLYGWFVVRGH